MNLTASLIVHNELTRYLYWTLPALMEFCDTVVVMDDHSDDGTYEWLEELAEGEYQHRLWLSRYEGDRMFTGEGVARQELLERTLLASPTHILAIDADEFIADGEQLRQIASGHLKSRSPGELAAWKISMEEIWDVTAVAMWCRCDGGWRPHGVPALYSVPDVMTVDYRIRSDQLACGRVPQAVERLALRRGAGETGTEILHLGWANPGERAARYARYVEADGGRFHASTHLKSIMWDRSRQSRGARDWPEALAPYKQDLLEFINGREAS